jgi:hypothetical protein
MNKYFNFLLIAGMLIAGMALTSCENDDEPGRTPEPVIHVDVHDDYVEISATGEGEVVLYRKVTNTQLEPDDNPVRIGRSYRDLTHEYAATAKEAGKEISNTVYRTIEIPMAEVPKFVNLYSEHESQDDSYYQFTVNMRQSLSKIYMHNVMFTDGDETIKNMTILLQSPVTFDKNSRVYTFSCKTITPILLDGQTQEPMNDFPFNNFLCTMDIKNMTYNMSFDCLGSHLEDSGKLTNVAGVFIVNDDGTVVITI